MQEGKTIAIILARMGSSRIPGKVLMPLNGIPALKHVHNRVSSCPKIDKTLVATSTNPENDAIEEFCKTNEIPCFRGDEEDVLNRFYECANSENESSQVNTVLRITADCPFVDPTLTSEMIDFIQEKNYDYVHNRHLQGPPLGFHAEVIAFSTLKKLNETVTDKKEREHVTLHILKPENRDKFKIKLYDAPKELQRPNYRLLLDEDSDIKLISKICEDLGNNPSINEVINYLDNNPEIARINKDEGLDFKELLDK